MTDDFDLTAWNNGELCEHGEQWHADCKPAADGTQWVYMTEGFSAAFHYRQTHCARIGHAKSNDPAVHLPDLSSPNRCKGRCQIPLQNLLQTLT